MRIRVFHETKYSYDAAPGGVIQTLRLTPRNHDTQYVVDWRIDVSADCRLERQEDAFGNITHAFSADGPFSELRVLVEGEVETQSANGVVTGTIERFPAGLYLRETDLTRADAAIVAFARSARGDSELATLHTLLDRLHESFAIDPEPTDVATSAAQAFALKRGVCQDLTHIFIAAARANGIPARYVGGYLHRDDSGGIEAGHAWAEAHVPILGWVGFDAAGGVSPTDRHVRVAAGLDYYGAAPVRGTRYGGGGEMLAVRIRVERAPGETPLQSQSQSQN